MGPGASFGEKRRTTKGGFSKDQFNHLKAMAKEPSHRGDGTYSLSEAATLKILEHVFGGGKVTLNPFGTQLAKTTVPRNEHFHVTKPVFEPNAPIAFLLEREG